MGTYYYEKRGFIFRSGGDGLNTGHRYTKELMERLEAGAERERKRRVSWEWMRKDNHDRDGHRDNWTGLQPRGKALSNYDSNGRRKERVVGVRSGPLYTGGTRARVGRDRDKWRPKWK